MHLGRPLVHLSHPIFVDIQEYLDLQYITTPVLSKFTPKRQKATSPPTPDDRRLHHHQHQMTEGTSPPTPDDRRLHHHQHQMTEGYITTNTR
ncbi:hypothetical protein Hamer_G012078, partial [Homarus americanus]